MSCRASFAWMLITSTLVACGVHGADAGDLASSIEKTPELPDSGLAPGSDGVKRLSGYVCVKPPPPAVPSKTVPVAAGPFLMGCNPKVDTECKTDELPTHTVTLDAFAIDVTEVSQGQYYECVKSGACLAPTCDWDPCGARPAYPVVCVNHTDAETYCAWKQKRLPTEAEWEKAARGPDGQKFPWGNEGVDCIRANMSGCKGGFDGNDGTAKVGSHPAGASPYGALDMAGNIAEWVEDFFDAAYYATSPSTDPKGPTKGTAYVGRGGGWRSEAFWLRASTRDDYDPMYFKSSGGFRCAN